MSGVFSRDKSLKASAFSTTRALDASPLLYFRIDATTNAIASLLLLDSIQRYEGLRHAFITSSLTDCLPHKTMSKGSLRPSLPVAHISQCVSASVTPRFSNCCSFPSILFKSSFCNLTASRTSSAFIRLFCISSMIKSSRCALRNELHVSSPSISAAQRRNRSHSYG